MRKIDMNITGTSLCIREKLENDHEITIKEELIIRRFIALKNNI
jgi:hypothetical protein